MRPLPRATRPGPRAQQGMLLLAATALAVSACTGPEDGSTTPPSSTHHADAPTVTVTPSAGDPVNPTAPIKVKAQGGTLADVSVTNTSRGTHVHGEFADDHSSWHSTGVMGYGQTYTVKASTGGSGERATERTTTLRTIRPETTSDPTLIPGPDAVEDGGVGVGMPITLRFSHPVKDKERVQQQLHVTSDPEQQGAWYWIDDRNVHYRPKEFWQPGTTISVRADIYGVDFGGGVYGATDVSGTYRVHDSWIAKADADTKTTTVYHGGKPVKIMPVSLGKDGTPTHRGIHVVSEKKADVIMDSCTFGVCKGDPGYYRTHEKWAVRISNDGEFVHENPASVGAQGNTNVSHGCVNANAADAKWFYDHFAIGDVVRVVNSGGPPLPVWDRYGDWSVPWQKWKAGNTDR